MLNMGRNIDYIPNLYTAYFSRLILNLISSHGRLSTAVNRYGVKVMRESGRAARTCRRMPVIISGFFKSVPAKVTKNTGKYSHYMKVITFSFTKTLFKNVALFTILVFLSQRHKTHYILDILLLHYGGSNYTL